MSEILKKLNAEYIKQLKEAPQGVRDEAMSSYRLMMKRVRSAPLNGNSLMSEEKNRLVNRIGKQHIGRLCMFYYYPKTRDKLPYYDRYPMVIPIRLDRDGFLGLNFHYLPPRHRALLMDELVTKVIKNNKTTERKRILLSYQILKTAIRINYFIPTIKKYLYSHLKSRIYMIEPEYWNIVLFLPLERFEKAPISRVYVDSLRKIRKGR